MQIVGAQLEGSEVCRLAPSGRRSQCEFNSCFLKTSYFAFEKDIWKGLFNWAEIFMSWSILDFMYQTWLATISSVLNYFNIPWFSLIFSISELRYSREALNTSRDAARKKNLWLFWTWISLSCRVRIWQSGSDWLIFLQTRKSIRLIRLIGNIEGTVEIFVTALPNRKYFVEPPYLGKLLWSSTLSPVVWNTAADVRQSRNKRKPCGIYHCIFWTLCKQFSWLVVLDSQTLGSNCYSLLKRLHVPLLNLASQSCAFVRGTQRPNPSKDVRSG